MYKNNPSKMQDFTRGSEIWIHQFKMFLNGIGNILIIGITLTCLLMYGYLHFKLTKEEVVAMKLGMDLNMRQVMNSPNKEITLFVNGKPKTLTTKQALALTQNKRDSGWGDIKNSAILGLIISFALLSFLILYWWQYGTNVMADERLRGAVLVESDELKSILESRKETSEYTIAGVPMRKGSETLNIAFVGTSGSGKSQGIRSMLEQIRAKGKKVVIYDPSGEFAQEFFREGKDVLMNPFDERSPNWNVWQDVKADYHYDNIASALIPTSTNGDPFWPLAGRRLLTDVMRTLGENGQTTNEKLYTSIAISKLEETHTMLAGKAGANFVDPKTDKTGINLKMTVLNQLESFRFLPDEGEPFSIRDWVANDDDSWMFITVKDDVKTAILPIISLWISLVIKGILALPAIHRERMWLVIDELPTLQKMDDFIFSLTNTRKYGLCHIVGIQDWAQFYETYGENNAKTMTSTLQTKVLLRVTDPGSADLLSKIIGQAEIDEKLMSRSMGIADGRDGDSFYTQRKERSVVLPSEIMSLPDLTGYIKLPGDFPVGKIKINYVSIPQNAIHFIERGNKDSVLSFGATSAALVDESKSENDEKILSDSNKDNSIIEPSSNENKSPVESIFDFSKPSNTTVNNSQSQPVVASDNIAENTILDFSDLPETTSDKKDADDYSKIDLT